MNMVELPDEGVDLELGGIPSLDGIKGWVRQVAYDVDERRVSDLVLVTAELVGNARRHAEGPWRVRLSRFQDRGVVRVEVQDHSPSLLPVLGRAGDQSAGTGLLLVNRLAVHWGFERHEGRKVVWAEVPTA